MEKHWSESELLILKRAVAQEKGSWRESVQPWVAAAFCTGISLVAVFEGPATPAFLSFLPMCFFFMALPIVSMRREIAELRKRLDIVELRGGLDKENRDRAPAP